MARQRSATPPRAATPAQVRSLPPPPTIAEALDRVGAAPFSAEIRRRSLERIAACSHAEYLLRQAGLLPWPRYGTRVTCLRCHTVMQLWHGFGTQTPRWVSTPEYQRLFHHHIARLRPDRHARCGFGLL